MRAFRNKPPRSPVGPTFSRARASIHLAKGGIFLPSPLCSKISSSSGEGATLGAGGGEMPNETPGDGVGEELKLKVKKSCFEGTVFEGNGATDTFKPFPFPVWR